MSDITTITYQGRDINLLKREEMVEALEYAYSRIRSLERAVVQTKDVFSGFNR